MVDQIKSAIERGELQPRERLPSERELARQFGISRMALREALRVLESIGYVTIRRGAGTYVSDTSGPGRELLSEWLRAHDQLVRKLFELREVVEPGLARLAAQRRTPALLNALQETIDEMEAADRDGDLLRAIAADAAFHRRLANSTQNSVVQGLMNEIMHSTGPERRASLMVPGQVRRAIDGHRAVLEAVASGDAERAAQAMSDHLADAQRFMAAYARADQSADEGLNTERGPCDS